MREHTTPFRYVDENSARIRKNIFASLFSRQQEKEYGMTKKVFTRDKTNRHAVGNMIWDVACGMVSEGAKVTGDCLLISADLVGYPKADKARTVRRGGKTYYLIEKR